MIVAKFGGTSVADRDAIERLRARLRRTLALANELGADVRPVDLEVSDEPVAASYQLCLWSAVGPADQLRLLSAPGPRQRLRCRYGCRRSRLRLSTAMRLVAVACEGGDRLRSGPSGSDGPVLANPAQTIMIVQDPGGASPPIVAAITTASIDARPFWVQ